MGKLYITLLILLLPFCAVAQKARFEFYDKTHGLVGNQTQNVIQDDQGFIWFLNDGKIVRFDGRNFLHYALPPGMLESQAQYWKLNLHEDSLLLLISQKDVTLLNPKNDHWEVFPLPQQDGPISIVQKFVTDGPGSALFFSATEDKSDDFKLWRFRSRKLEPVHLPLDEGDSMLPYIFTDESDNTYAFSTGLLKIYNASGGLTGEIAIPAAFGGKGTATWAALDANNNLVCLADYRFYKLDKVRNQWVPLPANRFVNSTNTGAFKFVFEKNGSIWMSGTQKLLMYYDAVHDTLFNFRHELEKLIPYGCNFGEVFQDKTGVVWVATQLGLLKVAPEANFFDTYFSEPTNDKSFFSFRGLAEDAKGMVYASYYQGGGMIDPVKKKEYTNVFPVNIPFGLYVDKDKLWVNSGILWDIESKTSLQVPGSVSYSHTQDWGVFAKDKNGQLWWSYHLDLYVLETNRDGWQWKKVVHFPSSGYHYADVLHAGQTSGLLWIGLFEKLLSWSSESEKLQQFGPKDFSLPVTRIMAVEEDKDGSLWLGTDLGLIHFHPSTGSIRQYTVKDGLPNDYICSMLSEGDTCLWLGTNHGLSRFHKSDGTFANFFKEDGLTADEFNRVSYLKAHDGRMFFGGMRGINAFYPNELVKAYRSKNMNAHMVLSSFERTDEKRDTILHEYYFGKQPEINLYHWDRSFTFEYALTDFTNPKEIMYSYKMEGYEDIWSEPSKFNFTRFSSLPSGKYVFRVRARDSHGLWHPHELAVTVIVHPPWWATWWAYLVYALALVALVYFLRRYEINRQVLKANLNLEKLQAEQLKELDHFKSRLYTNLTHEFRTPLTVILGMVQQILNDPGRYLEEGARLIESNGKNLLRLINQLLDLSKLESNTFQLHPKQADIVPYLRYITESFQTYANSQNLSLRFFTTLESLVMDFDPDQVQQVLTNLISNALKFTPSGGDVKVRIARENGWLSIEVWDTGIGIAEKDVPHVFDRFFQVDSSYTREQEGTGIGLSHTFELVKIMGGSLTVKSEVGMGSTFYIRLPITNNAPATFPETLPVSQHTKPLNPSVNAAIPHSAFPMPHATLPHLLIIEDNPDVVVYIKSCLEGLYQLDVAYNGKTGIEKAFENIPDLIISDVMMPEKDGYQVCETLKNDDRTSHIPIILLTAKADAASRIAGLKRGADVYLSKPFDKEELLVRLEMLLERQKRLAAYFSKNLLSTTEIAAEPEVEEAIQVEDAFLQKIRHIVEENYTDETFALPELCKKLGMSRSQLFRKMNAVSNTSPSDFIRSYRLNKAKTLLETTDMNVTEVAWQVGYKDLGHFSRSYLETFGISPSSAKK